MGTPSFDTLPRAVWRSATGACPVTTRPARRRKHASEAERRRDSAEGAELGPLSQREHLGGLAKSRLHGVLEDTLTRLNGAPVDRTALPLARCSSASAAPAASRTAAQIREGCARSARRRAPRTRAQPTPAPLAAR